VVCSKDKRCGDEERGGWREGVRDRERRGEGGREGGREREREEVSLGAWVTN
jgi:hypothetical protein